MQAVTTLAVGFERPANFNLAEYWKKSTEELSRQMRRYTAVLSLTAESAQHLQGWCVTRPVDPSGNERMADGHVTLHADFDSEDHARFTVLGLGSSVQVIGPAELRSRIHEEVRAMAALQFEAGPKKRGAAPVLPRV